MILMHELRSIIHMGKNQIIEGNEKAQNHVDYYFKE